MEKIRLENLTFKYPGCNREAIKNINISINQGEFICICGKSGSGKSTLLRHIKPSIAPNGDKSGKIYFDGREIETLSFREQSSEIGFVMQDTNNQSVCQTVWHELAFGLENLGVESSKIRLRVAEIASFFDLQHLYHKDISTLSGGQKQLINLASVLVMQPSLLVLDEPTSQLDPIGATDFLNTLKKINTELGTTIMISEQRLEELIPLSDRVIVMEAGMISADDTPQKVGSQLKQQKSDMIYALPTPMRVFYALENAGHSPISIREGKNYLKGKLQHKKLIYKESLTNSNDFIIRTKDVFFRYKKQLPDVIRGLNLNILQGEFYAIVGANGSGKTTTLLSLMGILKPYRGKIIADKKLKIRMLGQNPKSVFTQNSLRLEFDDILSDSKPEDERKYAKLNEVIDICELRELLNKHPYDLSGGEMQRAALAKVLLTEPDILLLDEPTKGLDAHFKLKLGNIITDFKKRGITVISVSHDIEFCAEYADRIGMFFDGNIVAEGGCRDFFEKMNFYTTAAARMSRNIIDGAIVFEDILRAIKEKN